MCYQKGLIFSSFHGKMLVSQNCVWMKFLTWSIQNVDLKHSLRGTSYVLVLVSLNGPHSLSHSEMLCLKLTAVIFYLGPMCLKNTTNRPVHIICSQPQMHSSVLFGDLRLFPNFPFSASQPRLFCLLLMRLYSIATVKEFYSSCIMLWPFVPPFVLE